jgi:N-acyl homoserine lactone hydrolase
VGDDHPDATEHGLKGERSIMSVNILPMVCGWLEVAAAGILAKELGRFKRPIPSFLIVHPKGRAVFDTRELQHDSSRIGPLAKAFTVQFQAGQELAARLTARGVDPTRIDYMINSNLHFDHVGGNADLPNAKLVVQRRRMGSRGGP